MSHETKSHPPLSPFVFMILLLYSKNVNSLNKYTVYSVNKQLNK